MERSRGAIRNAGLISIVDVDLDYWPAWAEGPLPVETARGQLSAEARGSYFNARVAHSLYGTNRAHRSFSPSPIPAGEVTSAELVRVREDRALLVVHARADGGPAEAAEGLAWLVDVTGGAPARSYYEQLLGGAARVPAAMQRAFGLSHVRLDGPLGRVLPSPAYDAWGAEQQWLWLLASATPFAAYEPPVTLDAELRASTVQLSAGWRALILRDGASFIGAGTDMGPLYALSQEPEVHFHSIYLDAFLVGHVQRMRLTAIADDLAGLGDPDAEPERLARLDQEMTAFRNVYWWQQASAHLHGTALLAAYQRQQAIPDLFSQLVDELATFASRVRIDAEQRTGAFIGLLTIVGLPYGLSLAVLHAIGEERLEWLIIAMLASTVVAALLLATDAGRVLVRQWHSFARPRVRSRR